MSEAVFDLIYDLFLDESWNPHDIRIEKWDSFIPSETKMAQVFPTARPLMIEVLEHDLMCDGYVDDGIMFGVESKTNNIKLAHAGPLVAEAIFRAAGEEFDHNRDPALSATKLTVELYPNTTKTVLGWVID